MFRILCAYRWRLTDGILRTILTLLVILFTVNIVAGAKKSKGICQALTLGVVARVAAGTACRVCLTLLERLLLPIRPHHRINSSNTLLHLVTNLLVTRVCVP
jgi:hypothetical protein